MRVRCSRATIATSWAVRKRFMRARIARAAFAIVAALGSGVTTLRVGDRVLAMAETGGYAEAVAVAAEQCHRLPAMLSAMTQLVTLPAMRCDRPARSRRAEALRSPISPQRT